MASVKGA